MNLLKLTTRLLLASCLVTSLAAQAEDFQYQAQVSYDNINPDGGGSNTDVLALRGTYYLAPVPTDGVPVGEAAYIARSSYAEVIASFIDNGNDNVDVLAANFGYHVPNTIFFGRVGVVKTNFSDFPGSPGDDTSWNGTFGIVPVPRLFFGTDFTEGGYDPNITVRYAGKLENDHWAAASVTVVDPDEGDTEAAFNVDYYFPALHLGAGFGTADDRWSILAETGLPHGFAILGRYFTSDSGDGYGLMLTWRDL